MRPSHETREPTVARLRAGYLEGRIGADTFARRELVLADDTVSRRHAELRVEEGRRLLRDLASSNGTWANGRRVMEAEVRPGGVLHLGGAEIRL
jgi:predicted component of type VI protein secretion system